MLFQLAIGPKEEAATMIDLLLLSIYTLLPPGRALEVRTLQIVVEGEESAQSWDSRDGNFAVLKQDGAVMLVYDDYKTAKHYGRDVTLIKVRIVAINPPPCKRSGKNLS